MNEIPTEKLHQIAQLALQELHNRGELSRREAYALWLQDALPTYPTMRQAYTEYLSIKPGIGLQAFGRMFRGNYQLRRYRIGKKIGTRYDKVSENY